MCRQGPVTLADAALLSHVPRASVRVPAVQKPERRTPVGDLSCRRSGTISVGYRFLMADGVGLRSGSEIAGVSAALLEVHVDERGSFTEYFSTCRDNGLDAVQWSVVTSRPGVLRGMHLHRRHDEYFAVISGHASVGLHDLRPGSPTYGQAALYDVDASLPVRLIFPRGLVHGWLFHEATVHLQAVSEPYVDYGDDDNHGCHWSDPELGIEWPFEPSVVSERSDGFGTLAELRARTLALS